MTSDATSPAAGDDLEPYLALAREIRREVDRVVADDDATLATVAELIDRYPDVERGRIARAVFDRLDPLDQWAVLADLFDDDELRRHLASEHAARAEAAARATARHELVRRCRAAGEIDVRWLPPGTLLTLGLFREPEVAAAVRKGSGSTSTARRLVLRVDQDGWARVVEDVFDPDRGYFVTGDYDQAAWQRERLASHARVQVGSLLGGDAEGDGFEPVVVPGARVDVRTEGGQIPGRLHLGFAMLAEDDVLGP